MKKLLCIISVISIIFLNNAYLYAVEDKNPGKAAGAAIAIEVASGRIMFQKNSFKRMHIASTTKIMTAILVLEKGNLSDVVIDSCTRLEDMNITAMNTTISKDVA